MEPASINLFLKDHCIETGAKKELKRLMDQYFEDPDSPDALLEKIELLRRFIEESDFPALRASDERLSGISEATVRISLDETDNFVFEFD